MGTRRFQIHSINLYKNVRDIRVLVDEGHVPVAAFKARLNNGLHLDDLKK
jgi:hypothetical protein